MGSEFFFECTQRERGYRIGAILAVLAALGEVTYSYSTKNISYIDVWPNTPLACPGWQQTCNFLEGEAYGTGHTVLGAVRSHVPARPAARQSFQLKIGSCRLGVKVYVLCVTGVLLWPPEGHPGQPLSWFGSYRRLSPKFQFSLSGFTLGIYL